MMIRIVAGTLAVALLARCNTGSGSRAAACARWRLEQAIATQQQENDGLEARNRALAAEVRDLKDGHAALEERARTDLGMIGANETFYQVVPPEASNAPATQTRSGQPRPRRNDRIGAPLGRPAGGRARRTIRRSHTQAVFKVHGRAVLSGSMGALLAERSICGVVVAVAAGDRRFARLPEARRTRGEPHRRCATRAVGRARARAPGGRCP